jgi:VWFA-related protein
LRELEGNDLPRAWVLIFLCLTCQEARPQAEGPGQNEPPKFETKLDVVVVPVVVRDNSGRVVGNLKKEDFQVFDNDKAQALTGFTIQSRSGKSSTEESQKSAPTDIRVGASSGGAVPGRFVVFLFDDLHLSESDLVHAQEASSRMLADSFGDTDAGAVFSISGKTNSGVTRDRAKLAAAITSVHEQSIYRPIGHRCPEISYYQAYLILDKNDDLAFKTAVTETAACSPNLPKSAAENRARATASEALGMGDQSTRVTLEMIKFIVQKMGTLPGQHSLILISPGFLTAAALDEKSDIINMAARANVTISALDARGLYVRELTADDPLSLPPDLMRAKTGFHRDALATDGDVMSELADGTGGSYFHNSNDLSGGLAKLALAPEYLYLLEFTPKDKKHGGDYHRLKVKVTQDSLKIQARRGYYATKTPN